MMSTPDNTNKNKQTKDNIKKNQRAEKMAEALRQNLLKRKDQARARRKGDAIDGKSNTPIFDKNN